MRYGLLALIVWAGAAPAAVTPNPLFNNGMVLQQGVACPVWGTADPDEVIKWQLQPGDGNSGSVTADKDGKWSFKLPTLKAGSGPHTLTLEGKTKVVLRDILVGEVWVCSGQSNMEWPLNLDANPAKEIAAAEHPQIRLFTVAKVTSYEPRATVNGSWVACGPKTVGGFSAVAYHFGVALHKKLGVPVGLIHTSWGGTRAEAWTSKEKLSEVPALRGAAAELKNGRKNYQAQLKGHVTAIEKYLGRVKALSAGAELPSPPVPPQSPESNPNTATVLYNAMIRPLQPFAIKGVIWYQGESNAGQAYRYRTLFPAMIDCWREDWNQGDFPFLFVQLAPFMAINREPEESAWAELREAQLLTALRHKNCAMAVITDAGDPADIHPRMKKPAGERLALAARALAYGEKVEYRGPTYDSVRFDGNKAVVTFTSVGKGLEARGGDLTGFTVSGNDGRFFNATAKIEGDTVVVTSDKVPEPTAVRYGWANCPVVNLWNKDGLPASPFRTDVRPGVTGPKSPEPRRPYSEIE
jgi:sialate O-acetylesterase